ncbi:MAG: reverse transcriptase domain-containing protein [Verrucomicrobiota bacterium]
MVLVSGPIFEADLCEEQMGFRPGRDAKAAVRLVYYQVKQKGRQEVVDADLSDYFNTIPHGQLMRSLSRRIADGQVLAVIRQWLRTPVEEARARGVTQRTTPGKDTNRGTPQGGVISPLLEQFTKNYSRVLGRRRPLQTVCPLGCVYKHSRCGPSRLAPAFGAPKPLATFFCKML